MMKFSKKLLFILLLLFIEVSCSSQTKKPPAMINREAAVAGMFYSADKEKLMKQLKDLFTAAVPKKKNNDVLAIISPHAGYVYSGKIAASAFNQIDGTKKYETIFIIGASHVAYFNGASIYNIGNFITPLGLVEVDTSTSNKLIKDNPLFSMNASYHLDDHCIEVQLPFLQYKMKNSFKIVPIIIGSSSEEVCKKLAATLVPYFNEKNLFIFSTDFSHYPDYKNAVDVDKTTSNAILTNSSETFIKTVKLNDSKKIPNLSTSICGFNAILTLLFITETLKNLSFDTITYTNSGNISNDHSKVVGYWAIAISKNDNMKEKVNNGNEFMLSEKDKLDLMTIARSTLESYVKNGIASKLNPDDYSDLLNQSCGAFVTLKKNGELKGCIGRFMPDKPLYQVVQDMTISSASQDYRFEKVKSNELGSIKIEISVLSPLKKINSIDEIVMGKHGIYIKKGGNSGTFLPKVAEETGWSKEEFLGHCSDDKAGLGWYGWKTADIYTYTAICIEE
jgi:AmmeMemoRadiSam system protein B/AmmeMemoRadiSam system protein A